MNPELDYGIEGWTSFGGAKIENRASDHGNKFIVALNRNGTHDSLSQNFNMEEGRFYIISGTYYKELKDGLVGEKKEFSQFKILLPFLIL